MAHAQHGTDGEYPVQAGPPADLAVVDPLHMKILTDFGSFPADLTSC